MPAAAGCQCPLIRRRRCSRRVGRAGGKAATGGEPPRPLITHRVMLCRPGPQVVTGHNELEGKAPRRVGGRSQDCLGGWGCGALGELPGQREPASHVVATLGVSRSLSFCVPRCYVFVGEPSERSCRFFPFELRSEDGRLASWGLAGVPSWSICCAAQWTSRAGWALSPEMILGRFPCPCQGVCFLRQ